MAPGPPPILVVDDDHETRDALRDLLDGEGYTVFEAVNGSQALEFLASHPDPCVVLLDRVMPQMDGIATLRAIAADSTLASRHAYILFTVNAEPPLPDDISARLRVPIVEKPFRMEQLLGALANAVRRLSGSPD